MISTQRIIVLALLINFVIGFVTDLHVNSNYDFTQVEEMEEITSDYSTYIINHDTETQTDGSIADTTTWGSGLGMTAKIAGIMFKGLLPPAYLMDKFNTSIEQLISSSIMIFWLLFNTIIGVEVIMFFKNKKTT